MNNKIYYLQYCISNAKLYYFCFMIEREITGKLLEIAKKYPILTITGPRQSGKTTLVKALFKDYDYVSLENPDIRLQAEEDPNGFMKSHPEKCIIDEIQYVPELLSVIQTTVDEEKTEGRFVLIGSQNHFLLEKVSQILAGRTRVVNLLPLSQIELNSLGNFSPDDYEEIVFKGFYPAIYDGTITPTDFYPAYIETLINRDVRQIQNIRHLTIFTHFLKLCAGRAGQILDYSSLARDAGVSVNTAKEWISILEASYVVFRLQPYYQSFGKRLIKSPKLYFYDTGILSYLLNIRDKTQLNTHYIKGNIFENFILLELLKYRFNKGLPSNIYFWRDNSRNEIDCLIDGTIPEGIEIKSGKTFTKDSIKQVQFWKRLTGYDSNTFHVVYGGDDSFKFLTHVYSWRNLPKLFSNLQAF